MLKRIFKFAWIDFSRNKGANIATIFVLVITISLATTLFLFRGFTQFLIAEVQEKIDVTAYFKENVSQDQILEVKTELSKFSSEVKDIQYISREEALLKFVEKHQENPVLMSALEEVGRNPFLASLNIRVKLPAQYENILNFLETGQFKEIVAKVDYYQKKPIIEKIFSITSTIEKFGIGLGIVLVLIVVLVVFNTIKLTIENSKEEISTMRLVGATNWFIRGPFIIQGVICGFFALLICLLFFTISSYFLSPQVEFLLPGFNLFNYFISNFLIIFLIQLGTGIILGAIPSYIVVRKYLKI